jgi:tetratricopeptide (TPR) repeat protein
LKKRSAADKAPARKATKTNSKSPATAASKNKSAKTTAKTAPARKPVKAQPKATKATQAKSKAPSRTTAKATLTAKSKAAPSKSKTTARKAAPVKPVKPVKKNASAPVKAAPVKPAQAKYKQPAYKQAAKSAPVRKHAAPPPPTPRQPTQDEAAALRAFERAHKEFVRGHFGEARGLFRALVDKHAGVSEVTARARTYLAIAESRLRAEPSLPRDADSLYDRGVIELNRGDYVAAQELFERALKREPAAAHIHYGLAAVRARLGSVDSALESLQKALELQPNLRIRAQHDLDLTSLRNDPEFERLVFAPRF